MRGARRHGFIGLGLMGEPMAATMIREGLDVVVTDLRPEPVRRLVELGATRADTVRQLAESVDVLHVMVVDDSQVLEVLDGPSGGIAHLRPGSVVVVHSTVSQEVCQKLAEVAALRQVELLDAPVAGGVWAAETGELVVMVGGGSAALDAARDSLDAIAAQVVHVGDVGAGQVLKAVNNMVTIINRDTLHRALRLGAAWGVSADSALAVLRSGSAGSWAAERYDSFFALAEEHPGGAGHFVEVSRKDLGLAGGLAAAVDQAIPSIDSAMANLPELFVRSDDGSTS